jgi:hypothetical protein
MLHTGFRWSARLEQQENTAHDNRASQAGRVDLVHLVCFVHLVGLVQPYKRNEPNNGILMLADFFSILLRYAAIGALAFDRHTSYPLPFTPSPRSRHGHRTGAVPAGA